MHEMTRDTRVTLTATECRYLWRENPVASSFPFCVVRSNTAAHRREYRYERNDQWALEYKPGTRARCGYMYTRRTCIYISMYICIYMLLVRSKRRKVEEGWAFIYLFIASGPGGKPHARGKSALLAPLPSVSPDEILRRCLRSYPPLFSRARRP